MQPRIDLQRDLEKLAGHVYFQPPTGLKMKFPAIVYELESAHVRKANNNPYMTHFCYTVTYISNTYDENKILEILDSFDMISMSRNFVSDNLYHTVFKLYY